MVEVIKYSEPKRQVSQMKMYVISFYMANLNFYILYLISLNNIAMNVLLVVLINMLTFKVLFGIHKLNAIYFWYIVICSLGFIEFGFMNWRTIIIILTSLINVGYYIYILEDGKRNNRKV